MAENIMVRPIDELRASAHPLGDTAQAYDPLLALIVDARFVLIVEATHGTMSSTVSALRSPSASSRRKALLHIDEARAVTPLDRTARWEVGEEVPETYPSAL